MHLRKEAEAVRVGAVARRHVHTSCTGSEQRPVLCADIMHTSARMLLRWPAVWRPELERPDAAAPVHSGLEA